MNIIRLVCFTIVMAPFLLAGFIGHMYMLGYDLTKPFFARMLLPAGLETADIIPASREEVEAFLAKYMQEHPQASVDEALKAFIKFKKENRNA